MGEGMDSFDGPDWGEYDFAGHGYFGYCLLDKRRRRGRSPYLSQPFWHGYFGRDGHRGD